jgi:hypothetical protein
MNPQFPEDVETVFPREHHVEQNEVQGREVQGGRQPRVAVVGGEDFKSLGLQVVRQQVAELTCLSTGERVCRPSPPLVHESAGTITFPALKPLYDSGEGRGVKVGKEGGEEVYFS